MAKRGDQKREHLLLAAADLFWLNGYSATSIADIAAAADVPLGNVYYYFKNKSDLAIGVADIFVSETRGLIDSICETEAEPRRRVLALIRRLAETSRSRVERGCPIAQATRDFRSAAPEAAETAASSFTILISFVARELQQTGLRPSLAMGRARELIVEWQGGIALAHAMNDATILAESFRRAEQRLAYS